MSIADTAPHQLPGGAEVSEVQKLLAPGITVTLADGREATIKFTFRSLAYLEDKFGSLGAVQALFERAKGNQGDVAIFEPLAIIVHAGLLYQRVPAWTVHLPTGAVTTNDEADANELASSLSTTVPVQKVLRRMTLDDVLDLLDPARLEDYLNAAGKALGQAFGDGPGNADPAPDEAPDASPGESATTPQPSSLGDESTSSGA